MDERFEENVTLAPYTTLQVGGTASYFHKLTKVTALPSVVAFAAEKKLPLCILGGGSNVLIADGKVNSVVIKNELKGVSYKDIGEKEVLVTAAAGEDWDELVAETVENNLSGLENLSGIPGSVGATPVQNINAYSASVADVIESVEVYDVLEKKQMMLANAACNFAYRQSIFKQPDQFRYIVTAVTFRLTREGGVNLSYKSSSQSISNLLSKKNISAATTKDVRIVVLEARKNIGMVAGCFQSAGSFFKNTVVSKKDFTTIQKVVTMHFQEQDVKFSPWYWELPDGTVKISTAFLLECSPYNKTTYGLKRYRAVVGLSPLHSLSVVTEAGATAKDVTDFVTEIKKAVFEIFRIEIETEVDFIF